MRSGFVCVQALRVSEQLSPPQALQPPQLPLDEVLAPLQWSTSALKAKERYAEDIF